jgi:hypothetical protein
MEAQNLNRIQFVTRHFNELQGLREAVPYGLMLLSWGVVTFFPSRAMFFAYFAVLAGTIVLINASRSYYRRAFGEVEGPRVNPIAQSDPPSVFSPAGPAPRPAVYQRQRQFSKQQWLVMTAAVVLFVVLRAISPDVSILTDNSAQYPWLKLTPPVVVTFDKPVPLNQTLTLNSVLLQTVYVLFGALLLGVWLRRERRLSQIYYLVLGALLLGLAALGASLGFVLPVLESLGVARIGALFLPAVAHFWMALILCGAALILAGLLDHRQLVQVLGKPAMEEPS